MAYNRNLRLPAFRRLSLRKLAVRIALPYSTLHREIQRGLVPRPILHHDEEYMEYSEHIAQGHVQAGAQNKGRGMRFTNLLAALLAIKIWEMDSIVSGVHGKGGLPVLIERKTRFCLIAKLRSISQLEIVRVLRALLRSGQRKKVLSLTTENGCEFLDSKRIETLFSKINAFAPPPRKSPPCSSLKRSSFAHGYRRQPSVQCPFFASVSSRRFRSSVPHGWSSPSLTICCHPVPAKPSHAA